MQQPRRPGRGFGGSRRFDRRVLVERGVDAREIEVSVLGNDDPQASVPGEVLPSREFYSYESKYVDGTSGLLIPAPLPPEVAEKIRRMAVDAYKAIDCAGMARVDFFLEKNSGAIYLNEINTIPGFTSISMYPKLWEASGLPYASLVDRLVELALERKADRRPYRTLIPENLMTTPQKNSPRRHRPPAPLLAEALHASCENRWYEYRHRLGTTSRTSATRKTTQTARQAYTPASLILPGDPRPVAPTTLRKMRTSAVSSARESKGSAFGMNAQANARGNVVSFHVPVRGSKAAQATDGEKFTPQWLRYCLQPRPHQRARPGHQPSQTGSTLGLSRADPGAGPYWSIPCGLPIPSRSPQPM